MARDVNILMKMRFSTYSCNEILHWLAVAVKQKDFFGMVQKGPEIGNTRACEDASTLGSIVLNLVFETSGCFMRLA